MNSNTNMQLMMKISKSLFNLQIYLNLCWKVSYERKVKTHLEKRNTRQTVQFWTLKSLISVAEPEKNVTYFINDLFEEVFRVTVGILFSQEGDGDYLLSEL